MSPATLFAELFPTTSTTPEHQTTGAIISLASESNSSHLYGPVSDATEKRYVGTLEDVLTAQRAVEAAYFEFFFPTNTTTRG